MAESEQNIRDTPLHSKIYDYEQKLRAVESGEGQKSGTLSSNSDSDPHAKGNGSDSSEPQRSDNTYASVYQSMFEDLAQQENASDRKIFRDFIAKDFSDRFVKPQTIKASVYRRDITRQLQSSSTTKKNVLPGREGIVQAGVQHGREGIVQAGVQHAETVAAVIGQVAKDSPEEAQALFSQLDTTLQTQVMSVQSDSFTPEQKLALLEGAHSNMLGNVISGSRALVSALSLASLGAIFIAGVVLGGPVGGTFAVGLAEMGAVSAHFMASRAARVFASIFENFRLERALSRVSKKIDAIEAEVNSVENTDNKEIKNKELSQLRAERTTLLAKRSAARKEILLKTTEFFSGVSMLVIVAMIPPPVTGVLVLAVLSDFVGSKLEKFSHTLTGPGLASQAARVSLRVFSFALQFPRKVFQGVNNLGKLCEAQAIKTENKLLSFSLQVVGAILQSPNKLVNGISSLFTQSPEDTVSLSAGTAQPVADSERESVDQRKTENAKTVKEGVEDNVKEQKVEMTADVAKESAHLAVRAAGGEVVASFFDVLSSFQDLRAYFFTQPSEKKHLAALIDIVHEEVHGSSAHSQPNQAAKFSNVSSEISIKHDNSGPVLNQDKKQTIVSSHANMQYRLSDLKQVQRSHAMQVDKLASVQIAFSGTVEKTEKAAKEIKRVRSVPVVSRSFSAPPSLRH